jgi:putative transcriptional regulator
MTKITSLQCAILVICSLFIQEVLSFRVPFGAVKHGKGFTGPLAFSDADDDGGVPLQIEPATFNGPGVVLLAQPGEYNHYLMKATVFIYEHGKEGSQGVILERPSAWTLGETAPGIGVFERNTLFMGGEEGSDMAMMFHSYAFEGTAKPVGSGIFIGGLKEAREMVEGKAAHPRDFKFFFNYVGWPPGLLEKEIAEKRWDVCRVPPRMVLEQNDNDYSLWYECRKVLKQAGKAIDATKADEHDE